MNDLTLSGIRLIQGDCLKVLPSLPDDSVDAVICDLPYGTTACKLDVMPNSKEKADHPTQKPVTLLEYLIKAYTNEGDCILDATMGSGSTMVACAVAKV